MKETFFYLIIFLAFGCQRKAAKETELLDSLSVKSQQVEVVDNSHQIRELISRLNPINLPFVYNLWDDDLETKGANPEDSVFVRPYHSIAGYLPDTSHYFGIIVVAPADASLPILYTFDKKGRKLDKADLFIYRCGPDCGLDCEEYAAINKELEIDLVSKSILSDCEDRHEFGDSVKISKITQAGSINSNGTVSYQEPVTKSYIPDANELSVSGWNSKYFEGGTEYFLEKMKIKWINDSTINYQINFAELEMGCETELRGTAINKCPDCDPEIDEQNDEAFPVHEFITQNNVDFIYSIRVSIEKDKAMIRQRESDEPKDECMPGEEIVLLRYAN